MESGFEVVGRHDELAAIDNLLQRLALGPGSLVLVGPAGMGKTTVWRHGGALAREAGLAVLAAAPSGAEGRLPFAGLADLLGELDPALLERLPAVQRAALDAALLRGEPGVSADARTVATGLLSTLRLLAERRPVLIAVDDAQFLDRASAAALTFALRRVEASRIGVLASLRVDGARPRNFLDDLVTKELELKPLSVAAIHAIAQRELGESMPRPTLVKVVTAAGGNPFYAIEIPRELLRLGETSTPGALPIPAELHTLVQQRVARLPKGTRDALLLASCLTAPRTSLVPEDALAPAEHAGVVRIDARGRIFFEHPLLAAAVYDSVTSADRRNAHRELAQLIEDPEERAIQLALGALDPDESVARELDAGAERARSRGATEAAAALGELALRLTPEADVEARLRRLVETAALQFEAGDLARSQVLLEEACERAPAGSLRARVLQRLGQVHMRRSGFLAAVEFAEQARAESGDDAGLSAEIELDLLFDHASLGDFAGGSRHSHVAVELAEQTGDELLLAVALGARTMTDFVCGHGLAQDDLDRALALEGPLRSAAFAVRPSYLSGILQLWSGQPAAAVATLDALRLEALELGGESELPLLYVYLVWAHIWTGELERAAACVEQSTEIATLLDDRFAAAMSLAAAALLHGHQGDAAATRREAAQAAELFEQLKYRPGAIWPQWALGLLALALDDPAAVDEALAGPTAFFTAVPADPVFSVFVPDEIEALVALGRAEEAWPLLEVFEGRARAVDRAWALAASGRCRALLLSSAGDLDGALDAMQAAAARYDEHVLPFERARTLLELGRLRRRRKEKRLARLALEAARDGFSSLGLAVWTAKAGAELARVTTRRAAAMLTVTETQIARLAADGLTNRQIAERAFVGVHTVEANLTRAYRKLGITSRAQLARALEPIS